MSKPLNALVCINKAIRLKPKLADGVLKKSICLFSLNRFNKAVKCYERAVSLNRTYPVAF